MGMGGACMIWLTKDIVLERYAKESNPIKLWSVFVFLVGGVGAVFLTFGLVLHLALEEKPNMIFVVLGGLLMLVAAVIFGCSVREYLSVRRRVMEDDFRSVKVTCTDRNLTRNLSVRRRVVENDFRSMKVTYTIRNPKREAVGEDTHVTTSLELWFEDQAGNVHRRYESSPSPELLAVKKGSVHYLVGIKKNKSWRLFQLYSVNEWRVDW